MGQNWIMDNLLGFILLVGIIYYFVKKRQNKSEKATDTSSSQKTKSVRWECNRCGNDWQVNEPVPKDYKSHARNHTADGKNLDDNKGRPWVCSDCGTYTLTNPKK